MLSQETVTKTEHAYQTLRQDILEVRLAPDTPLRLGAIRESYGVGWTPLREALSRLEAEHLVHSTANKGYAVASVSIAELADLTKTKGMIELQLLSESMEFGNQEWEARIVAAHYRLSREVPPFEQISDLESFTSWSHLHDAFHNALISSNQSPWLSRFYRQVTDHMHRHGRALRTAMPYMESEALSAALKASPALRLSFSLEPHTALMDAVINRQIAQAVNLIQEHNKLTMLTYDEINDGFAE